MTEAHDTGLIEDDDELLHRQVHPTFMHDGEPSSQAFRPTPKDEGHLSVSRDAIEDAEAAYRRFTEQKGLASAGVWSLKAEEARAQNLSITPAPIEEPEALVDPAHALIDFTPHSKNKRKSISKKLKHLAVARGPSFLPA